MSKKASEGYINYRKKFCEYKLIRGINELADYWLVSPLDACTRLITDGVVNELKKKKEIEEYKKLK